MDERSFLRESYIERHRSKHEARESGKYVDSYIEVKRFIDEFDPEMDYKDEHKNEIARSLKEDFADLLLAIRDYIQAADQHEFFVKQHGAKINQHEKDKLEELSKDRFATHNILMRQLNVISYGLSELGIDNDLIRAIVGEDRKLDLDSQDDRRPVERWARSIARYLATIAETTKER